MTYLNKSIAAFLIVFLSFKASASVCSGYQPIAAEYLQKFGEFNTSTTAKLESWGRSLNELYATVLPWEGQLVRIPSGQFENLQIAVQDMQAEVQKWPDL